MKPVFLKDSVVITELPCTHPRVRAVTAEVHAPYAIDTYVLGTCCEHCGHTTYGMGAEHYAIQCLPPRLRGRYVSYSRDLLNRLLSHMTRDERLDFARSIFVDDARSQIFNPEAA